MTFLKQAVVGYIVWRILESWFPPSKPGGCGCGGT